jgi:multisubunit Na+/H+ antiporter MnhB subunit
MNIRNPVAAAFLAITAIFIIFSALLMHPLGTPDRDAMDQYIIDNTVDEAGANNAVTAVVFDYRGIDTLVGATALFAAIVSVVLLFRRMKK